MRRESICTDRAPGAVGPYSQAVRSGSTVFVSGQIPIDPATGERAGETVGEQTRRVLQNLGAVMEAAGGSLADVVKTTVYLKDLSRFAEMNAAYAEFFSEPFPARATLGVSDLPLGVDVEIDAIAVLDAGV